MKMKAILVLGSLCLGTLLAAQNVEQSPRQAASNGEKLSHTSAQNNTEHQKKNTMHTKNLNESAWANGRDTEANVRYTVRSAYDLSESSKRLEKELGALNLTIFARFDHGKNASDSGIEMPASVVYVFGSPVVGTHLMLENPAIALELPLRIAIYEDEDGNVWLSAANMKKLAKSYALAESPIIEKMDLLLQKLLNDVGKKK